MTLKEHLTKNGKTDSWINLANQFQVKGTNKQKSDYVRRLFKVLKTDNTPSNITYCQAVNFDGSSFKQPDVNITTSTTYTIHQRSNDYPFSLLTQSTPSVVTPQIIQPYLNGDTNNVLFIGDLHLPFTKEGYLEFCREQQGRFNCGTVIYAGDILDHHAQSFHHSDADGLSARDELNLAIKGLEEWYRVFPKAVVLLGNHDRIVARKLFSVGVSQRWLRPLGEVLNTPNYEYLEHYVFNNILYVHGEEGDALKKAQNEMRSVACGHSHSTGYVQLLNGGKNFAMQVGCGIDFTSYAFAYAKRGRQPIMSCGVILDQSPILIPFQ